MYLPLYTHDKHTGWGLDGFKLRTLFAVPHADDRRFFYGANFEFSYNARRWDEQRFTSEIRPIVGWHLKPWDVIINPIFDTSYDGLENLNFVPSTRVAYNFDRAGRWLSKSTRTTGPSRIRTRDASRSISSTPSSIAPSARSASRLASASVSRTRPTG